MARPQVAHGGTACNMEGSCEYIEIAVADSRQGVVLQLGGWTTCYKFLTVKLSCYETFIRALVNAVMNLLVPLNVGHLLTS